MQTHQNWMKSETKTQKKSKFFLTSDLMSTFITNIPKIGQIQCAEFGKEFLKEKLMVEISHLRKKTGKEKLFRTNNLRGVS